MEKFVFSSLLLINEILGVHVCIYVWWRIGRHRVNAKVAKYFMRWEVAQSTSHTHTHTYTSACSRIPGAYAAGTSVPTAQARSPNTQILPRSHSEQLL